MDILGKISHLREERNWSEYQLSVRSGLTQSTISSWYRKNTLPTIPSLERICDAFGISMSQFFMEENETQVILEEKQIRLISYMERLDPAQAELITSLVESMSRNKNDS